MNLIIADESKNSICQSLRNALESLENESKYLAADKLDISPCAACSNCSGRTFGRCVIRDDMQQVLPLIVRCRKLVLVGPVTFGGPGFHIKKVIDRMTAVGDPRYYLKDGELVKGMAGEGFRYDLVGMGTDLNDDEKVAFQYLHRENCHIMGTEGRAFLLDDRASADEIKSVVEEIANG